jgi:hypothetical protein
MDLFQVVKGLTKQEAIRISSVELAIRLHDFRDDVSVDNEKIIADAKRIVTYLETGS